MFLLKDYIRPESLSEAMKIAEAKPYARWLAGCTLFQLFRQPVALGVDLTGLVPEGIERREEGLTIGAMTTMRQLETSPLCLNLFGRMLPQTVAHLGGIALRNQITVGGTVCAHLGYSELLTALVALDARLHFFRRGWMYLSDYLASPVHDILLSIALPVKEGAYSLQSMRGADTDRAILAVAASNTEDGIAVAVGGRPAPALLVPEMEQLLLLGGTAQAASDAAAEALYFGSDTRATAVYRKRLCAVLIRRALEEVTA